MVTRRRAASCRGAWADREPRAISNSRPLAQLVRCRVLLRRRRRQMTTGRWNSRNRITKEIREQILYAYLGDSSKGSELARSNGLTAAYAYKLAYERGLLPTRDEKLLGRSHTARLAST